MARIVGLPKLSPTMEEGTLSKWMKKEGDAVEVDDLIAEVETDKATMEWRAFDRGVLLKIIVAEGTTLKPDMPVAIFGNKGEDFSELLKSVGSAPAPVAAAIPALEVTKSAEIVTKSAPVVATASASTTNEAGETKASPAVRKAARDRSLDLAAVQGTGPFGRIILRDLDKVVATGKSTSSSRAAPRGASVREPLSQMRKAIARRLTESKQQVPHFYLTIDIDAEPLSRAREEMNAYLAERAGKNAEPEKVSLNDLLLKAVAVALRAHPETNSSFVIEADGPVILRHQNVDLSVAVAVTDGLVTPVIRSADQKSVLEIAREVRDFATRARAKKLKPEEMTGGTFSVSNLGMYGIEEFSAVINPPEGAILAVGAVRDEPVLKNGAVVAGKRLRMTMSCDHRVVDGAVGAVFLKTLRALLEKPALALL